MYPWNPFPKSCILDQDPKRLSVQQASWNRSRHAWYSSATLSGFLVKWSFSGGSFRFALGFLALTIVVVYLRLLDLRIASSSWNFLFTSFNRACSPWTKIFSRSASSFVRFAPPNVFSFGAFPFHGGGWWLEDAWAGCAESWCVNWRWLWGAICSIVSRESRRGAWDIIGDKVEQFLRVEIGNSMALWRIVLSANSLIMCWEGCDAVFCWWKIVEGSVEYIDGASMLEGSWSIENAEILNCEDWLIWGISESGVQEVMNIHGSLHSWSHTLMCCEIVISDIS